MKKLFIVLGLGLLLASCASQTSVSSQDYVKWRCSNSPNCNITAIHHHAW
jgi:hypothetical protein